MHILETLIIYFDVNAFFQYSVWTLMAITVSVYMLIYCHFLNLCTFYSKGDG